MTSNVGDHRHSMRPVVGSIFGLACFVTGNGPPRHTSRPPIPRYQPMRNARALTESPSELAMIDRCSPGRTLSADAYALTLSWISSSKGNE